MGFSRQEYWSGLPFPSPVDLPDPGIKPRSPALQADTLPSEPPGKPKTDMNEEDYPDHLGGPVSASWKDLKWKERRRRRIGTRTRMNTRGRARKTGRKRREIIPAMGSIYIAPACPSWQPALQTSGLPGQPPQLCKPIPCNKYHNIYFLQVLFLVFNADWYTWLQKYHTLLVSLLFHQLLLSVSFALSSIFLTAECLKAQGSVLGPLFSVSFTQ